MVGNGGGGDGDRVGVVQSAQVAEAAWMFWMRLCDKSRLIKFTQGDMFSIWRSPIRHIDSMQTYSQSDRLFGWKKKTLDRWLVGVEEDRPRQSAASSEQHGALGPIQDQIGPSMS